MIRYKLDDDVPRYSAKSAKDILAALKKFMKENKTAEVFEIRLFISNKKSINLKKKK